MNSDISPSTNITRPDKAIHPGYARVTDGIRLVDDFRASGLSQSEFARQRGICQKKVSYWVRRIRSLANAAQAQATPTLVQVATVGDDGAVTMRAPAVPPAQPVSRLPTPVSLAGPVAIEIRLGGGRTIAVGPGFDRDALRSVIGVLEEATPCSI